MAFLNSILLWGGLALAGISVPIIIHLLNRYRHKQIDWGAMELLRKALVVRSRQVRMEDILLLILRCTAAALIALALARPSLMGSAARGLGKQQVGVVIGIDASYSMSQRDATSRFEQATQRVREVLKTLDPGDPVTIVLMGQRPHILLRNVPYEPQRFSRVLDDAAPLAEGLSLERCLEECETLMRELKSPVKECYLVSDAQITTWKVLSDKSKGLMRALGSQDRSLFYLPTDTPGAENLGISRFELASGALRKGMSARYVAEVENFGPSVQQDVVVSLYFNDQKNPIEQQVIPSIAPHEKMAVPFFLHCDAPGNVRLTARLGRDAVMVDNARHAVAHVRDMVKVLCVDGEPSEVPTRAATTYLLKALLPKRAGVVRALSVDRIPWTDLPARKLADYDVVVLANVGDLPAEQVRGIYAYVKQGGGLVMFLGGRVNQQVFNARMKVGEDWLSPGELEEVIKQPPDRTSGWALGPAGGSHPIIDLVRSLREEVVATARVSRFFKIKLTPGARTVLQVVGPDLPLLAEKQIGRGKVLLWTTSANREWAELPIHPLFPILLHEAVTSLTQEEFERPVTVGTPLSFVLSGEGITGNLSVKNPSGGESAVKVVQRDGQSIVEYAGTDTPGFYEIQAPNRPPMTVAVNVDTAESNVECLTPAALELAFSGLPVRVPTAGDDLAASIVRTRRGIELWQWLLGVGIALLLVESFLAWRFSKRLVGRSSVDVLKSNRETLLADKAAA
ncbi:MAG: BatA domain-containing protein [Tepidisphaeraceae bacterium]|jgi:hypothetical protein